MNNPIVSHPQVSETSVAYRFGREDALRDEPCVPEAFFVRRLDQVDYCRGYASVKGNTFTTMQFLVDEVFPPSPTVRIAA